MKISILLPRFFIILSSFFIAQTSLAYLQYTYSSSALEWQSTLVNDQDYGGEINSDSDGTIGFHFSFNIDENLLSNATPTSFIINNAAIHSDTSLNDSLIEPDFLSSIYGQVIINPDRTINYWNLMLDIEVNDLNDNDQLNSLRDHNIRIISEGGINSCNCDRFWEDMNATTQRPQNTWIVAATIDNFYSGDNTVDNWSVSQATVSEPSSLMLLTLGLLGFLRLHRQQKTKQSFLAH